MSYPSDLNDAEWQILEPLLPAPKATGRPRKWDLRHILNGIFYLLRSGCAWRMLPPEFPPWPTVHDCFRRFRIGGTWELIHAQLWEQVRVARGREATPSGAILDSQSVKTTEKGALLDVAALAMTRTRRSKDASATCSPITQGLVLKVHVTGAHCPERIGAKQLLEPLDKLLPRLQIVWADQGYSGALAAWMQEKLRWRLKVVRRTEQKEHKERMWEIARKRRDAGASVVEMWAGLKSGRGIEVLPRRWVVERTFAWLGRSRRLSKDYEFLPQASEAMIYLTMTRLMLKRLGKIPPKAPS